VIVVPLYKPRPPTRPLHERLIGLGQDRCASFCPSERVVYVYDGIADATLSTRALSQCPMRSDVHVVVGPVGAMFGKEARLDLRGSIMHAALLLAVLMGDGQHPSPRPWSTRLVGTRVSMNGY